MDPTRPSAGTHAEQPLVTTAEQAGQSPIDVGTSTWDIRTGEVIDLTDRNRVDTPAATGDEPLTMTALRQLNDQKDAILRTVAHDLRGPLLVIERFATVLRDRDAELSADERCAYAHRVVVASERLQRQLADLLDLDRLSRGLIEPRREPTELLELVRGCVAALDLGDRVTIDGGRLVADVDPGLVERIVENLLANSVRHGREDGRIAVHITRHDGGALLTVDDDGPGVPQELREAVFSEFETGHAPSTGSGVGLSVVRRVAELHGGRAWIEDSPNGGASLNVMLAAQVHEPLGTWVESPQVR